MSRNLAFALFGAIAGILAFRWARRKVDTMIAQTRPDALAARAARGARQAGDRVAEFVDDVVINTRRREAQIRAEVGMAPIVDAGAGPNVAKDRVQRSGSGQVGDDIVRRP